MPYSVRCAAELDLPEVGELMFEQSAQAVLDLEEPVAFFVQHRTNAVWPTHSTRQGHRRLRFISELHWITTIS